mgnify:CR=1 FL=1
MAESAEGICRYPRPCSFHNQLSYAVENKLCDRVFTTAMVSYPALTHIGEEKDFTPVIEKALELGGYPEDKAFTGNQRRNYGYGRVLGHGTGC